MLMSDNFYSTKLKNDAISWIWLLQQMC